MRDWRRKNPERAKEIEEKSHAPKKEERYARNRAYHLRNKDVQNAKRRAWHNEHREYANETRAARYFADHDQNKAKNRMRHAQARLTAPWARLLAGAEQRAKKRNIPFTLTSEWAESRWTGRCELTDIEFRITTGERRGCFSPSIDQIEPKRGYTPNNSRFILWAINAMKDIGSYEDVIFIAKAIVSKNS